MGPASPPRPQRWLRACISVYIIAQAFGLDRSVHSFSTSRNRDKSRESTHSDPPPTRWIINEKAVLAELARRETFVRALVTGDAILVLRHEDQLELVLEACALLTCNVRK